MRLGRWLLVTVVLLAGCEGHPEPSGTTDEALRRAAIDLHAEAPALRYEPAANAAAPVRLGDPSGAVSIAFALEGAAGVEGFTANGVTVFRSALHGADVTHVPRTFGVEDFVRFDARPPKEEVAYTLEVSRVGGLRLVGDVLEMLDGAGAPRLRVARPWVLGADGVRRDAELSLEGCAADTSPAAPWHRPVVAPGAPVCRLRVAWSGAPYPVLVDPTWAMTTNAIAPRDSHAMVALGSGDLLVVEGYFHSSGATAGSGALSDGELFNPATGTWATAGTLPWESGGGGRYDLALALMPNGHCLIVGGGGRPQPDLYDPSTGFSRSMASFTTSPAGLSATTLGNGLVLVAGGTNGSAQSAAMLYDPQQDGFTPAGPLQAARSYHTATMLPSGKVLFTGGTGSAGSALPSAELYDPVANSFTTTGPMGHARSSHVAVLLADGRVLVAGGGDPSGEIFDPTKATFSPAGTMSTDRASAQGVLLQTGHVMVAGGALAGTSLATVDVFDPSTLSFAPESPLNTARQLFTAAVLASGEVIVAGGLADANVSTGSAETWTATAAGLACLAKDDCASAVCRGGFCCGSASCTGPCRTCAQGTGACTPIVSKDDPASCTGPSTCDATGACKKKNGQACASVAECASGSCVDGFCCNSACEGQCEACDVATSPGICSPVVGNAHGTRPGCDAFGTTCGGSCDGLGATACAFPSAVTSCGSTCADAVASVSTCDGLGECVAAPREACSGNFACADATSCKTACATDADCALNFHCEVADGPSRCVPTAVCKGSIVQVNGHMTDCAPYNCDQAGACLARCAVVDDCLAPNVCSLDGECIAPSLLPSPSGCALSWAGERPGWAMAALGAIPFLRRRRRARR
jgi:hypothetical protein